MTKFIIIVLICCTSIATNSAEKQSTKQINQLALLIVQKLEQQDTRILKKESQGMLPN